MSARVQAGEYAICLHCKVQSPILPTSTPGRPHGAMMEWKRDHQATYHPRQAWQFEVRPHMVDVVYVVTSTYGTQYPVAGVFTSRDNAERCANDLERVQGDTVQVIECPLDMRHGLRAIPGDPFVPATSRSSAA